MFMIKMRAKLSYNNLPRMLCQMLSGHKINPLTQWVDEIEVALKQGDLKKINKIINRIPTENLAGVLNTKIRKIPYTFWGTPIKSLIHQLDFKTITQGLENLPDRLDQQRSEGFFLNLINQINDRVAINYRATEAWPSAFLYPFLNECACGAFFDRIKYSRRNDIENAIIAETRKRFSILIKQELNYLSFGSGYLLQDFILLFKLLMTGYSLNIKLIELNSQTQDFQNALTQLHLLAYVAAEKNLSFETHAFRTIQDCAAQFPDDTIDVAHAIDMPDLPLRDLSIVYSLLGSNGFLYIADQFHNILCTRSQLFFFKQILPRIAWKKICKF